MQTELVQMLCESFSNGYSELIFTPYDETGQRAGFNAYFQFLGRNNNVLFTLFE